MQLCKQRTYLVEKSGTTLVVCGDTPLIKAETMEALFNHHEETGAKVTC